MARTALPVSGLGSPLVPEGPLTTAPTIGTVTTNAAGGTILAGTYLVVVSVVLPVGGETIASNIGSITTSGTTSTITIPSPTGYVLGPAAPNFSAPTGWYAYVSQLGGASLTRQQVAGSPTAMGTALTLTAPPTSTGLNPMLWDPAGTAADPVNGMQIQLFGGPTQLDPVPPAYDAMRGIMLRIKNTGASVGNLIVDAGVYPPAMRQFLGNLVVAVPASQTLWVGPLDMARHAVQDTTVSPTATEINIDFSAGFAGTITAFAIPRNVPGNP